MMKIIALLATLLVTSGCVMVDSRVSDVRPAAKGPESFVGRFGNLASYRSQSALGLYNTEYLQEYFGCFSYPERAEDVEISVDRASIGGSILFADGRIEKRRFVIGYDCEFKDGYLVFPQKSGATGGHDSPTLGFVGTGGARWTIRNDGSLVIITYGAGAGTVGIIPVGAVVRWMAVFPPVPAPAKTTKGVPTSRPSQRADSAVNRTFHLRSTLPCQTARPFARVSHL